MMRMTRMKSRLTFLARDSKMVGSIVSDLEVEALANVVAKLKIEYVWEVDGDVRPNGRGTMETCKSWDCETNVTEG
ncbi:hypothetical protein E2562_027548 [Oryza meyeriana var. granulata]|uniref:Uncharacterized protein n=1 Tax=Oryza meyeriana var. granulata TaxID=110450 RepID=A0A6G1CJ55_9ORYZ|nr:hypothetical protein E2562_027548 [Oryza meyeriana var. granulata]